MSLFFLLPAGKPLPVVEFSAISLLNTRPSGACIAYIKLDADGSVYESDNTGAYGAATEVWLESGETSEVWVERTITAGTLTQDDIGASRVACTSDLVFGNLSAAGTETGTDTLDFFNQASGGTAFYTRTNLTTSATRL
jgi:hypothetical protein